MLPRDIDAAVRGQRVEATPDRRSLVAGRMGGPFSLYILPEWSAGGIGTDTAFALVRLGVGGVSTEHAVQIPRCGMVAQFAADDVQVDVQTVGGSAYMTGMLMPTSVPPRWRASWGTPSLAQSLFVVVPVPKYTYGWTWSSQESANTSHFELEFLDGAGTPMFNFSLGEADATARSNGSRDYRNLHPSTDAIRVTNNIATPGVFTIGWFCGVAS